MVQNVAKAVSNLLRESHRHIWDDIATNHDNEVGRTVTALMVGLEENAFLLADSVTSEKMIINPTENARK